MNTHALVLFTAGMAIAMAAPESYRAQVEQWRAHREASLKADGGWLTVTGLFWLHDGSNTFGAAESNEIVLPADPELHGNGSFDLHAGKVTMRLNGQTRELRPDDDKVKIGALTMFVIERGDRTGIRLKDNNSRFRKEFTGLKWYPVNEAYRIAARWVAEPQKITLPNILGQTSQEASPGYAEFDLAGQHLRLTPVEETPGELFFVFRDLTAGKDTYGSGRFLDTPMPENGKVVLDFNMAYNPPCAFTPYATCPLPPKQNRLPVRIEAGERKYGNH